MSHNKMYLRCIHSGVLIQIATQLTECKIWSSFITAEELSSFFMRNRCENEDQLPWGYDLVFEKEPVSDEELKHHQNVTVGNSYNVSGSSLHVELAGEENE